MAWTNLTAATDSQALEALESWLWEEGALAVTVEDGGNTPIYEPGPGELPLWGKTLVTGLFAGSQSPQQLSQGLEQAGFLLVACQAVQDRCWEREWLHNFKPMRFGRRLWICPSGLAAPADGLVVKLDPGLAFGTGSHETTRLCLEYLDGANLANAAVIDYGCGSGILAVAAALLGASPVYATDIDPQAITATQLNAERNGIALRLGLVGELNLPPAQLVLANILAQPLVDLADHLSSLVQPGGELVLSGIMAHQADWVKSAYGHSLQLMTEAELNGWIRLTYSKP